MDVARGNVEAFAEAFQDAASRRLVPDDLQPFLDADMELRLDEISAPFRQYLPYVAPYGQRNPEPVFVSRGVYLESPPREVGRGHLKFRMVQDGAGFDAIGFGLKGQLPAEALGTGPVDVAYKLRENTYRGVTTLQAQALDVRPAA
jgi:single-stranded-DNA-specific exonuclease